MGHGPFLRFYDVNCVDSTCSSDKTDHFPGATSDWDPNQLFIESDWAPYPDDVPIEFRS
jgi:hypothetical protein